MGAIVVNRWFAEQQGLVLGVLTASTATGQLVFLLMLASLVERFGWRSAVLVIAVVTLMIIPLIALLMHDRPSDLDLRPFGAQSAIMETQARSVNPIASTLNVLKLGMRSRDFWLLNAVSKTPSTLDFAQLEQPLG